MNERLKALADAGVSIWLDDLSRERLTSGSLKKLIDESSVTGVTTNPTIFAAALSHGESYADQITTAKGRGDEVEAAIRFITTDDVREACKLFRPVYDATHGYDGRVSIEVDPRLAKDPEQTASQARDLHQTVGEDNVLIKIPATQEGLAAITHTIAEGISVNVTLIFSTARYKAVMDAYMSGLEKAAAAGKDLRGIHSVASFFVSRVDSEVDARLDKIGTDEAKKLKGKAALANARIAFEAYRKTFASERWQKLAAQGANVQRPLWASTGTKNKDYSDVLYVTELVTDGTVNTMPEKTMQAFADHGEIKGDTVIPEIAQAHKDFAALEAAGIDLDDVYKVLEDEGVEKFVVSWGELIDTVQKALDEA